MKGNNTLTLNQATMIEALQLWAEAKFKQPPKITSVRVVPSVLGGGESFSVECTDPEPPKRD